MYKQPSELGKLGVQAIQDSEKWFGDTGTVNLPHMTLALAGEVGELANIVKKIDRKSLDHRAAVVQHDLAMELTDCFIYILCIAGLLGVDLQRSYDLKRKQNEERFMREKAKRNGQPA